MITAAIVAIALLAVAAGLAFWMIVVEPRAFQVRRVRVPAADEGRRGEVLIEDARLSGLKILHVTDTHFHGRDTAKLQFLRRVAREDFDLVFLTGDLIDTPGGMENCLEAATYFRPRIGTFAVLGGHDHFRCAPAIGYLRLVSRGLVGNRLTPNPAEELTSSLEKAGVRILDDANFVVSLPSGREAAIVGLRDCFSFEPSYDRAWDGIPDNVPVIVIAHSPDVRYEAERRGAKLAFFGHTHGGQVRLPFVGALITRCGLPRGRASGTFKEKGLVYTINNGVGASRFLNFRLLCRPEVTVFQIARSAET